jgi:hypothetical protein
VKIITPDSEEVPEDLMVEIAFLKQISHPNIIKFFGGYRKGDEIFVRAFPTSHNMISATNLKPHYQILFESIYSDCYGIMCK